MRQPASIRRIREIDGYAIKISVRRKSSRHKRFVADYYRPDGVRRRYPLGTADATEAEDALDTYLDTDAFADDIRQGIDLRREQDGAEPGVTFGKLTDFYVDVYLVNRNRADKTRVNSRTMLDEFAEFATAHGVRYVRDLTRPTLDAYISRLYQRGVTAKTVHNHMTVIRAAVYAAEEGQLLAKSPITHWPSPKLHDVEIHPLEREEVAEVLRLVHAHKPYAYPIIAWIALTGNRPSDARDLRFNQVNIKLRVAHRTQVKVKRLAKYDLSPAAVRIVAQERLKRGRVKGDAHVFLNAEGNPWQESALYRAFKYAVSRGDFDRTIMMKDLRHTYGHFMANDPQIKCPLPKLQVQMGHHDIQMTLRYVFPGDAQDEVAAYAEGIQLPGVGY